MEHHALSLAKERSELTPRERRLHLNRATRCGYIRLILYYRALQSELLAKRARNRTDRHRERFAGIRRPALRHGPKLLLRERDETSTTAQGGKRIGEFLRGAATDASVGRQNGQQIAITIPIDVSESNGLDVRGRPSAIRVYGLKDSAVTCDNERRSSLIANVTLHRRDDSAIELVTTARESKRLPGYRATALPA